MLATFVQPVERNPHLYRQDIQFLPKSGKNYSTCGIAQAVDFFHFHPTSYTTLIAPNGLIIR
jgi:hypothetical protein